MPTLSFLWPWLLTLLLLVPVCVLLYRRLQRRRQRDAAHLGTLGIVRDGGGAVNPGRRRHIPELHAKNWNVRQFGERVAQTTPIQGTAADMIKTAMVQLHRRICDHKLPLRMLLQVHDELVCESPKASAKEHAELVAKIMRDAIPLSVPVTVDAHTGDNWLDAK